MRLRLDGRLQSCRELVRTWRSPKRTALRVASDRLAPPPRAFARFGDGAWVVPPVRIEGAGAIEVGDSVIVLEDSGLLVDAANGARLVLGDRCRLAKGVEIICRRQVTLGPGVSTSDYVTITDSWAGLTAPPGVEPPTAAPVLVEAGAYLGWGCVVGPGVTVGAGAFVGEGAVVLDDVSPGSIVYGNPAHAAPGYAGRPSS
ncbi:MAG: acyltransferase [Acidimicrobiia bacterium]|nr:acyltransferase [Acidimicrobiia bacterium]